jgi:hypothetical protein
MQHIDTEIKKLRAEVTALMRQSGRGKEERSEKDVIIDDLQSTFDEFANRNQCPTIPSIHAPSNAPTLLSRASTETQASYKTAPETAPRIHKQQPSYTNTKPRGLPPQIRIAILDTGIFAGDKGKFGKHRTISFLIQTNAWYGRLRAYIIRLPLPKQISTTKPPSNNRDKQTTIRFRPNELHGQEGPEIPRRVNYRSITTQGEETTHGNSALL